MSISKIIYTVACLGALSLSAKPCLAQDVSTKVETVRFVETELGSPAGTQAFLARLDGAAKRVCTREGDGNLVGVDADRRDCMTAALADAVRQIHNPGLTAAYEWRRLQPVRYASAQGRSGPVAR